jgi:UDP-N-acetylmuramyl pentapeptide phosphotransferase/UDP-N-acetylglucosamine-1-phosphate transferase
MTLLTRFIEVIRDISPFIVSFMGALLISLLMTPVCRQLAIRMGMVDMPSKRRINKEPIPRSGGLAIYISFTVVISTIAIMMGERLSPIVSNSKVAWLLFLSGVLCVIGLIDDKKGLSPKVKFLGQLIVAVASFFLCGVGFRHIPMLTWMPMWLDLIVTTLWIVGAINAFNLIDGVDGLATGLAVIAAFGMATSMVFIGYLNAALVFIVFIGSCLGFLRYNFNPASVFLGDTGSMFLGFILAVLPLLMKAGDSFLVSIGVPILCMGIPIFDTFLAIVRRSIRAQLKKHDVEDEQVNTEVMQADTDHLHHRKLRKFVSQKAVVFSLYFSALFLVLIGLAGVIFRDYAAGIFIIGFIIAVYVVISDMKRIELWDAGKLLNLIAHSRVEEDGREEKKKSKMRSLRLPILVFADVFILIISAIVTLMTAVGEFPFPGIQAQLVVCVMPLFISLVLFRIYSIMWARAMFSNYIRLVLSLVIGTAVSYSLSVIFSIPRSLTFVQYGFFLGVVIVGLILIRVVRQVLRDLFFLIDISKMNEAKKAKRVLVYGAGLRYRAFRRELVRNFANNTRYIVGIIDDDIYLKSLYIGNVQILGSLKDIPRIIEKYKIDAIVIACDLSPERLSEVKEILKPYELEVTFFTFNEINILNNKTENKEGE